MPNRPLTPAEEAEVVQKAALPTPDLAAPVVPPPPSLGETIKGATFDALKRMVTTHPLTAAPAALLGPVVRGTNQAMVDFATRPSNVAKGPSEKATQRAGEDEARARELAVDLESIYKTSGGKRPGVDLGLLDVGPAAERRAMAQGTAEFEKGKQSILEAGQLEAETAAARAQEVRQLTWQAAADIEKAERQKTERQTETFDRIKALDATIEKARPYVGLAISPMEADRILERRKSTDPEVRGKAEKDWERAQSTSSAGTMAMSIIAAILSLKNPNVGAVMQGLINHQIRQRESWLERNEGRYKSAFNEQKYYMDQFGDLETAKIAIKQNYLQNLRIQLETTAEKFKEPEARVATAKAIAEADMQLANLRAEGHKRVADRVAHGADVELQLQADLARQYQDPMSLAEAYHSVQTTGWAPMPGQTKEMASQAAEIGGAGLGALAVADSIGKTLTQLQVTGDLPVEKYRELRSQLALLGVQTSQALGMGAHDRGTGEKIDIMLPGLGAAWVAGAHITDDMFKTASKVWNDSALRAYQNTMRDGVRSKMAGYRAYWNPDLVMQRDRTRIRY